ncbi:MAG: hypothetical protein ACRCZZ_10950, partial [Phocaeicola sp.]
HGTGANWKSNLHAHMVFDWTQENGKSCKLNKQDMAEMQTILADCLGMERGKSSDVKHLNAVQFKNEQEEKRTQVLAQEVKELKKEVKKISVIKEVKGGIVKTIEKFKDLLGITINDKQKNELKTANNALKGEIKEIQQQVQTKNKQLIAVKSELTQEKGKVSAVTTELEKHKTWASSAKKYVNTLQQEVMMMTRGFNTQQRNTANSFFPTVGKLMQVADKSEANRKVKSEKASAVATDKSEPTKEAKKTRMRM